MPYLVDITINDINEFKIGDEFEYTYTNYVWTKYYNCWDNGKRGPFELKERFKVTELFLDRPRSPLFEKGIETKIMSSTSKHQIGRMAYFEVSTFNKMKPRIINRLIK